MAAFVIASLGTTPASGAANGSSELTATAAPVNSESANSQRSRPNAGLSYWAAGTHEAGSDLTSGAALAAVAVPERCPSGRRGLAFYRSRYAEHRAKMGAGKATRVGTGRLSCPRIRYLAKRWRSKAFAARVAAERWMDRVTNDAILAIRFVFGPYAVQALVVAECESGLSRHAHNGQYLGIFQMGSSERRLYGHGETFLAQAWAAWRYFDRSGRDWSPWSCKP